MCRERGHDDNLGTTASPVRSVQRGLQLLHVRRAAARAVPVRTLLRTGKGKQTGWQQLQNVRRRPPAPHTISYLLVGNCSEPTHFHSPPQVEVAVEVLRRQREEGTSESEAGLLPLEGRPAPSAGAP